jgi:hypothetical protein
VKELVLVLSLTAFGFSEFSRSGDIVTDSETGFMWEDQSTIAYNNWKGAIDYCENLTLGGYSDWRLPNINELRSIVDYGRNSPAIDPVFQNTYSSWYWTSTVYNGNSSFPWLLGFNYGYDYNYYQSDSYYVRCLR